jgi:FkbM family methyltransferase
MLKLNLEKYKDDAMVFNLSISNKTEIQKIFYSTYTASTTLIAPIKTIIENQFSPEFKTSLTETITLDDFIDKNKIEFVDLIKCDAEGSEPEVLEGLKKNCKKVHYISIDTGPERNNEWTTNSVITLLEQKNFEIIKTPNTKERVVVAKNKAFL